MLPAAACCGLLPWFLPLAGIKGQDLLDGRFLVFW